jgi:hypothetical protein
MLTPAQRQQVYEFMRDSFLDRLEQERGFVPQAAYRWMARFNSVGLIMPHISMLWDSWWSLQSCGQAVAAFEYCSGLMYFDGENPLFEIWTPSLGGGGPYLWNTDSMLYDCGWLPENVEFLKSVLTLEFINTKVEVALERLRGQPEFERAAPMREQLSDRQELIASRIAELPQHLASADSDDWLV